jgi:hypothetical protein
VSLGTTDPLTSPEVRALQVELLREAAVLLRPGGTEYHRGVQVSELPVAHPERLRTETLSDSGVSGFRVSGAERVLFDGLALECYSEAAIAQLRRDLDTGDGTVVAEDPETNQRLTLRLDPDSVRFTRREGRWKFDRPHHYVYEADGISGEVIASEALEPDGPEDGFA